MLSSARLRVQVFEAVLGQAVQAEVLAQVLEQVHPTVAKDWEVLAPPEARWAFLRTSPTLSARRARSYRIATSFRMIAHQSTQRADSSGESDATNWASSRRSNPRPRLSTYSTLGQPNTGVSACRETSQDGRAQPAADRAEPSSRICGPRLGSHAPHGDRRLARLRAPHDYPILPRLLGAHVEDHQVC